MKRYRHLTKEQRYTISVCLRKKLSLSAIAKLIDVNKTTVSREITGQTHEIFKNHHDINKVAQVVNRCFRVGLKKSTI